MTKENNRQLTIKFPQRGRSGKRCYIKAADAVPPEWMQELSDIRVSHRISNGLLANMVGFTESKVGSMLRGAQKTSKGEYAVLKLALDKLTGKAPLEATDKAPGLITEHSMKLMNEALALAKADNPQDAKIVSDALASVKAITQDAENTDRIQQAQQEKQRQTLARMKAVIADRQMQNAVEHLCVFVGRITRDVDEIGKHSAEIARLTREITDAASGAKMHLRVITAIMREGVDNPEITQE